MPEKIRWGVLGVAKIATVKVIPGMQQGKWSEVTAIASRDADKARTAAQQLKIPKWYGSYEQLLADPDIDAIYIPLPNHLHVRWSIRCAEARKHVLCEKPIALSAAEARTLIPVRDAARVKMGEAFMSRTHPQWLRVRDLARSGRIGDLRLMTTTFSYFNADPANVRNVADWGGGALMDIGCYPITLSRMIFGEEPERAMGLVERDPKFKTDRLTSAILEFKSGQCVFTCSTQLTPYQRTNIFGTKGSIDIEIPVNTPPNQATRIFVDGELEEIAPCDQYTIQGDLFSRAILDDGPVPVPIEDAVMNMAVIDAIMRSAKSGRWESPAQAV
jgi:predicted dehydrogenase